MIRKQRSMIDGGEFDVSKFLSCSIIEHNPRKELKKIFLIGIESLI